MLGAHFRMDSVEDLIVGKYSVKQHVGEKYLASLILCDNHSFDYAEHVLLLADSVSSYYCKNTHEGPFVSDTVSLLLYNPSDLNQIRSMRSFAFITSNTKSGRLSRSSYTKATQSSRCCGVASIMLHFVQMKNTRIAQGLDFVKDIHSPPITNISPIIKISDNTSAVCC
ncbi:hypothetical protein AVEN_178102-1 [Araneus ventricosus]|uniref:Uncharacterized protein n=1 Tax=Araneus ventricosus TaxID=182803 RepID=A0A4Y2T8G5_ARAVE|nr:hypothetical protein AVEN_223086-1 [Araneus ventricosus]GBN96098.1 hypothetical protein AVEN_178102-1 [Araneus ventricosus]